MAKLYQQLGCTEQQSWYKTLLESSEFNQIEPFVTAMMHKKQAIDEDAADESQAQSVAEEKIKGKRQARTPSKPKQAAKRSQSKRSK